MAFTFNGSTQSITGANAIAAYPLTMGCWFNPANITATLPVFAISDNASSINRISLECRGADGGDPLRLAVDGSSVSSAGGFSASVWQHAAGRIAVGGAAAVFLTGVKTTGSVSAFSASVNTTAIGQRGTTTNAFFNGGIAECAIWSAELTDDEIASLAKGFTPDQIRPQSLVFYAPMIRDLIDVRAGLALTNNNGATVSPHPRIYA